MANLKHSHQLTSTRLLLATHHKSDVADDNVAPRVDQTSCVRLSSHHSVYDALTNPELEFCANLELDLRKNLGLDLNKTSELKLRTNPELEFRMPLPSLPRQSFVTPPPPQHFPLVVSLPLDDPCASFMSWQSVDYPSESGSPSPHLPQCSPPTSPSPRLATSILSSTDENSSESACRMVSESMVWLPSLEKATMVFETDEEDADDDDATLAVHNVAPTCRFADDDKTLTIQSPFKQVSVPHNQHSSFIMPRLSLSDTAATYKLTVLSSSNESLQREAAELIRYIRRNINMGLRSKLQISHLVLTQPPFDFDIAAVRSSDLIFMINDGAWAFSQFMACFDTEHNEACPKLTIVNIITSNYFVNLLEIINRITPQQVWKSSSLRNEPILMKFKNYLESEMGGQSQSRFKREFESHKQRYAHEERPSQQARNDDQSVYLALVPGRRTNYRQIERQITREFLMSLSYHNVDPLNLSSSLGRAQAVYNTILRVFCATDDSTTYLDGYETSKGMQRVCSFSMGFGVGMIVTSAVVALFSNELLLRALFRKPEAPPLVVVAKKPGPVVMALEVIDRGANYVASCVHVSFCRVLSRSAPTVESSVLVIEEMLGKATLWSTRACVGLWEDMTKATRLTIGS